MRRDTMSLRARRHRRIVSSSESDDTGDEINVASPSVLVERLKERDTGKVLVRNGVGTFTGKAQKLQRAMWFDHVAIPTSSTTTKLSGGTSPSFCKTAKSRSQNFADQQRVSTITTKTNSTASSVREDLTSESIHATSSPVGHRTDTMRPRKKSPKTLVESTTPGSCGRITRSKAAPRATAKAVGRQNLHVPTPGHNQHGRVSSTPTSVSDESDASDIASLSSRTSSTAYVDDSGCTSSDYEDEAEHVQSSSEDSEQISDAESSTAPKIPVTKRLKLSQRPKPKVEPLETKDTIPKPPNRQVKTRDAWSFKKGVNEELPPISNIIEIFDDITSKAMDIGFEEAIRSLGSRKLKLATMCSGTESPLLALQLVSESLKKNYGFSFEIEHMFSAEIVPFKQAYIERNFHPSIIFRDVREMIHNNEASTAYGSEARIPANVDILVAGFSCVDFSRLNAWRKNLRTVGESGDTFRAVLNYAKEKRPALVVLENVLNAPWDEIAEAWTTHAGYAAMYVKVDTKQYYIPHTRQRGYMLCIDKQKVKGGPESVAKWGKLMGDFQRPASSPVEAFLLSEDDPRVHLAREEMTKSARGEEKPARDVDWTLCQGRHQDYRAEYHLGTKRPLTGWQEGGSSSFPDYAWIDWNKAQTDRVKDTCDLSYLRSAMRGFDLEYKTRSIELSQNIDRFLDTTPSGITSCITPTGQPYITTRGRPLTGLEALALQGLPIDSLLLTRENTNQLQDLAGNAMTSTVVGAAILSALIVGHRALKGASVPQNSARLHIVESSIDATRLTELPLELAKFDGTALATILRDAERSRRLCYCEGQVSTTSRHLQRCIECLHTTCEKCGGIPTHMYKALDPETIALRITPQAFEETVKKALPMRLTVSGLLLERLEELRATALATIDKKTWEQYTSAITPAFGEELRFHSVKRTQVWTIHYDAPSSKLELLLHSSGAEWRLYAKVPKKEPGSSELRQLLQRPFARSRPASSLFDGSWQFCVPCTTEVPITIEGRGRLARSWESRIGLQAPEFADKHVWTELRIKVRQPLAGRLELNLSGDYKWLPDCGTASCGLHKKTSGNDSAPIFFFLDPKRTGTPAADQFVFSTDIHRLSYDDTRSTIARAEASWRPSSRKGPQEIKCSVYGQWLDYPFAAIRPFVDGDATFAVPGDNLRVAMAEIKPEVGPAAVHLEEMCAVALNTLLHCKVRLSSVEEIGWKKGDWVEAEQNNQRALYSSFNWLTEKARDLNNFSDHWRPLQPPASFHRCQECAPDRPVIAWRVDDKSANAKIVPYEDPREAGLYERAIKARPTPFVTRVRIDDNDVGQLTIGLNVCTLIHRALANLWGTTSSEEVNTHWRLNTKFIWQPQFSLPKFTLLSNKNDRQSPQPPHWRGQLRPEQLRSLSWMVSREASNVKSFVEEEVEEAVLPQMGWRAEGRATRRRQIRGGVLADEVGYGKTAITLGLIDLQFCKNHRVLPAAENGKIPIKATLIVVPMTLITQWRREIEKFLGSDYGLLVIQDQRGLGKCTIGDFMKADIIIAAWSMFDNPTYLEKLATFAALPEAPSNGGRAFQVWYKRALGRISNHLDTLMSNGARSLSDLLKTELAAAENDEELLKFVPSKRLRGSEYVSAQEPRVDSASLDIDHCEGLNQSNIKPGLKRKADTLKAPKEKPICVDRKPKAGGQDPFGLKSSAAKTEWQNVTCPLFQLFEFNRLVVDEYTYLKDKDFTFVTTMKANYRWVLSGTPPLDDVADVKIMAGFLRVHLGIDDDAAGIIKGRNIKAIRKDRTVVEQFQSFRQVHSPDWHLNQHKVAQRFLDQFVRRNKPDIGEIPCREDFLPVRLPAAERASYMELNQQLMSQDMKLPRGGAARIDSDRMKRLKEIMGSSKTPEEALLKRCSHFTLEDLGTDRENASQDCDLIVQARMSQYTETQAELTRNLRHATWLKVECQKQDEHFMKWKRNVSVNAFGDIESRDVLMKIIKTAEKEYSIGHEKIFYKHPPTAEELQAMEPAQEAMEQDGKAPVKATKKASKKKVVIDGESEVVSDGSGVHHSYNGFPTSEDNRPTMLTEDTDKVLALRALTGHLRNLTKELVSRTRALRFFRVVRAVQIWQSKAPAGQVTQRAPTCSKCKSVAQGPSTISILGFCGHTACASCLAAPERGGECIALGCDAPAHGYHIHKAIELGQEDRKTRVGRHYGKKMEDVMDLIKNKIPEEDQVLLFVQFNDLMEKVSAALKYHRIEHWAITENSRRNASKMMDDFQHNQDEDKKKVLVLNLADESAAGANLVNANHVIFLSPLLADTRQHYEASMTQAIGRALRYGQLKPVRIYRFLSLKTIDVDIIQGRTQKKLAKVDGEWGLYHESVIPEGVKEEWGGGMVKAQYLSDTD